MGTMTLLHRRDTTAARHLGSGAGEVDVDVPFGWVRSDDPGAALLVARPSGWTGPVVPSLTLARVVSAEAPTLAAYADCMVPSTLLSLGGHLVHLGSGHRPVDHLDLTIATEQWGSDLTVTARHVMRPGGGAVVATGAAADADWAELAATLLRAVRSLRVRWRPVGGAP
ncbi:MAG TPA: hypothetical protein VKB57_13605 [Acidimicrobiales bacterium]|nr:hypothetical protein [Acidimicrobiales bacterium]